MIPLSVLEDRRWSYAMFNEVGERARLAMVAESRPGGAGIDVIIWRAVEADRSLPTTFVEQAAELDRRLLFPSSV